METSAKTGNKAVEVFTEAVRVLYKDYLKYKDRAEPRTSSCTSEAMMDNITLESGNGKNKKKCAC